MEKFSGTIVQRKDEALEDFVKRALTYKQENQKDYNLVFNNGLDLTTENYELDQENLMEAIKKELDAQKTHKGEEPGLTNTVVQNENEDVLAFTTRAYEAAKEKNGNVTLRFQNGIELSTKGYNLEDVQTPNLLAAFYEGQTEKTEEELKEIQKNLEARATVLDTDLTDPLQFLLDASSKKYHSEEQQGAIEELERQRNQLLENKEKLLAKIVRERNIDMNAAKALHREAEIKKSRKLEKINRQIDFANATIEGYEKALESIQQDEIYSSFQEQLEAVQKQLAEQQENESTYELQTREILLQAKLDSRDDYINYLEAGITENQEKVEELNSEKQQLEKEFKEECQGIIGNIERKYGKTVNKNGTKVSEFDSIPEVLTMNQSIMTIEAELARLQRDPEEIHAHIQEMMQLGQDPELVAEEVQLLASTIKNPIIYGLLVKDQNEYMSADEQMKNLEAELAEVEARYNENNYFNEQAMIEDKSVIELLEKGIQQGYRKEEVLETELQRYEEQKRVPEYKKELKKLQSVIQTAKASLDYFSPDKKAATTAQEHIDNLKEKEQELKDKINRAEANGKVSNPRTIHRNLDNTRQFIREQIAEKKELETRNYIDVEARARDRQRIEELNKAIEELKIQKDYLGIHTVEELQEKIVERYRKELQVSSDELEGTYEDAPASLLDKIKNNQFKEKARAAFAKLTGKAKEVVETIKAGAQEVKEALDVKSKLVETFKKDIDEIDPEEVIKEEEEKKEDIQQEPNVEEAEEIDSFTEKDQEIEEFSSLEKMLEGALGEYVEGKESSKENITPVIEENKNRMVLENVMPGMLYAIKNGVPEALSSFIEAQECIDQGIEVVSTYETEGGGIDFLELQKPASEEVRTR